MVPFESLSHYPIIDSFHWLREEIQLVVDKFLEEKCMGLMASTLFSRTFLLIFRVLPTLVVVLIVMRLIVMTSWWFKNDTNYCLPLDAKSIINSIALKAVELYGFDITDFLNDCVFLMCLFIFVGFLKSSCFLRLRHIVFNAVFFNSLCSRKMLRDLIRF